MLRLVVVVVPMQLLLVAVLLLAPIQLVLVLVEQLQRLVSVLCGPARVSGVDHEGVQAQRKRQAGLLCNTVHAGRGRWCTLPRVGPQGSEGAGRDKTRFSPWSAGYCRPGCAGWSSSRNVPRLFTCPSIRRQHADGDAL